MGTVAHKARFSRLRRALILLRQRDFLLNSLPVSGIFSVFCATKTEILFIDWS